MTIYYTDGSASPNPGPGGFAVIRDFQPWILGSEDGETTNIRMEGKALIAALRDAGGAPCVIYTDSEFWINVVTKWAPGWQQRPKTKIGISLSIQSVMAVESITLSPLLITSK